MAADKKKGIVNSIFYGIAYQSGRIAGRGRQAVEKLNDFRNALREAMQKGMIFYCFLSFGVYLLQRNTAGHVLPGPEKIRRRFRNVLPAEAADKLTQMVINQKRFPDLRQIEAICELARRNLPLDGKHELMKLLVVFSHVDGVIESEEITGLRWIAGKIGIEKESFDRLLATCAPNASIVDKNSFYKILGLDESASSEEIHKAYRRMAAIHHPDRFATKSAEEQQMAHDNFIEINKAFRRLK